MCLLSELHCRCVKAPGLCMLLQANMGQHDAVEIDQCFP